LQAKQHVRGTIKKKAAPGATSLSKAQVTIARAKRQLLQRGSKKETCAEPMLGVTPKREAPILLSTSVAIQKFAGALWGERSEFLNQSHTRNI
jgi:hypothetical protein